MQAKLHILVQCITIFDQLVTFFFFSATKVGFKHHKDYVGYVWAKQEESDFQRQEYQVMWMCAELSSEIIFLSLFLNVSLFSR